MLAGESGQQEGREGQSTVDKENLGAGKSNCNTGGPLVSTFSAGLPPVPTKLVQRIQDGEFIDMGELATDRLGLPFMDDSTRASYSRRRPVTSIVEWAQCFSNYIAVLAQTQPKRVSDLLATSTLS